jgi:hypothetical protein
MFHFVEATLRYQRDMIVVRFVWGVDISYMTAISCTTVFSQLFHALEKYGIWSHFLISSKKSLTPPEARLHWQKEHPSEHPFTWKNTDAPQSMQLLRPISVGLSLFDNHWTTFCTTAAGLIKTWPIRTQKQR